MSVAPVTRALLLVLFAVTTVHAASTVRVGSGGEGIALPHAEGTRLQKADGTSEIHLLFSEKKPSNVTLVDAFGGDDLSLSKWIESTGETVAVKLSFTEGAEETYSMSLFLGAEHVALGGHASGDGLRGPFRKLSIKGDRIVGTLDRKEQPGILSGTFDVKLSTSREPEWLSGAGIASSPQGKALLAYAAAMRKLDFKTATKYSVRDEVAETKKVIGMMGEKRMKEMIRLEFGTARDFEQRLGSSDASMAATDQLTKIRLVQRDGSSSMTSTIGLVKVDGEWKVNW